MNLKKIRLFSIGPIVAAFLGVIILPISTWYFSVEDIGRFSMYQLTTSLVIIILGLGLDQGYVREYHEKNIKERSALFKTIFVPAFLLLFLMSLLVLFSPWSISKVLFGVESKIISWLVISGVYLSFISKFLVLILRMEERALLYSMAQLVPKLTFLLALIFFVVFSIKNRFHNLMIAHLSGLILGFLLLFLCTYKTSTQASKSTVDGVLLKRMLIYTLPLMGGGLAFWGIASTDKIFLRTFSNFEELGVYSVAYNFAGAALILQSIFSTLWAPQVYKWSSTGEAKQKVLGVISLAISVIIVVWALIGMFSWVIDYILPENYSNVDSLVLVVMVYPLLYTLSEATSVGIGITRKTVYALIATLAALIINLAGNYLLVPIYGAEGAGISSAFAFFIFFCIKTEVSRKIWLDFPKVKMYIFLIILLTTSAVFNLIDTIDSFSRFLTFMLIFMLYLFISKDDITLSYKKVLSK